MVGGGKGRSALAGEGDCCPIICKALLQRTFAS